MTMENHVALFLAHPALAVKSLSLSVCTYLTLFPAYISGHNMSVMGSQLEIDMDPDGDLTIVPRHHGQTGTGCYNLHDHNFPESSAREHRTGPLYIDPQSMVLAPADKGPSPPPPPPPGTRESSKARTNLYTCLSSSRWWRWHRRSHRCPHPSPRCSQPSSGRSGLGKFVQTERFVGGGAATQLFFGSESPGKPPYLSNNGKNKVRLVNI